MVIATSVKALIVTALAVLSMWRIAEPAAAAFALRASLSGSELILTLSLPAICVQLTTQLAAEITKLSARASCEYCALDAAKRSWS
jgi:hypothetical protein